MIRILANQLLGRSSRPYASYTIDGIRYRVEQKDPVTDAITAEQLAQLNALAARITNFIRIYLASWREGSLDASDKRGVDVTRLRHIYEILRHRRDPDRMFETREGYDGTSYVINQGEEMHMCIRRQGSLDRLPVLVTVLAHELAHIVSPDSSHSSEFWANYAQLQRIVQIMGIIKPDDARFLAEGGAWHCHRVFIPSRELERVVDQDVERSNFTAQSPRETVSPIMEQPIGERLYYGAYQPRRWEGIRPPFPAFSPVRLGRLTYGSHSEEKHHLDSAMHPELGDEELTSFSRVPFLIQPGTLQSGVRF